MGFFDFRCSISGLPLRAAKAVQVVLLELEPGRWVPASLPLRGTYDRLGSVDGFKPDFRTALFAANLAEAVRAGRVNAAGEASEPIAAIRQGAATVKNALHLVERATTMGAWDAAELTLDGLRVRQTLMHAGIVDAIVKPASKAPAKEPDRAAVTALLEKAFVAKQARWLFRELPMTSGATRTQASVALAELVALDAWLASRGRPWSPPGESGQYGTVEELTFSVEARARLRDVPELIAAIDRHAAKAELVAHEMGDDEYYGVDAGWLTGASVSWYGLAIGKKRVAATTIASLRQQLEQALASTPADALRAGGPEVLVVQHGLAKQRIDLRPLVRLNDGASTLPLSDPAATGRAVFNWDEIEVQLAPLEAPVSDASTAVLTVPQDAPWSQTNERFGAVACFSMG